MVGDQRQGWALFTVMAVLFSLGLAATWWCESQPNPLLAGLNLDQHASSLQAGGNMLILGGDQAFGQAGFVNAGLIEQIPLLGTGKTDYRALKALLQAG